jgi:hypothetical protein
MKINNLREITSQEDFDIKNDEFIIQAGASTKKMKLGEVTKNLDIKSRLSTKNSWTFLSKDQIREVEFYRGQSGSLTTAPIVASSFENLRCKIAGFDDINIPSGAKRVMLMAEVQDAKMQTRYRTENIILFEVGSQESVVLFILENIQDVKISEKSWTYLDAKKINSLPLSESDGKLMSFEQDVLDKYDRSLEYGPLTSEGLIPESNSSEALDEIDVVTMKFMGKLNLMNIIAWSY